MEEMQLDARTALPQDRDEAVLVGRAWLPGDPAGPGVIAVRGEEVFDLTPLVPTMSLLCAADDPVALACADAPRIAALEAVLANSRWDRRDPALPWLLAPIDLQAIKAAGVTFARSMLERVIEEQAKGEPARAQAIRARIGAVIGTDLAQIRPGSPEAARLKEHLIAEGAWSQYLEVGIGPDAEIFTKAQPLSAVGHGAEIGIHPRSHWNNPEPELVLVVSPEGRIVGATLGNDVNLRDVEGRSALLLGKAKDNNASCALGPLIRLVGGGFTLDRLRAAEIALTVTGEDGFTLEAVSSMAEISRDIEDLVAQTIGPHHAYPDGLVLFCGTMFAPVADRGEPGLGFTHRQGDLVTIASPGLGGLVNRVAPCDRIEPWRLGAGALMLNLAARGLLRP